MNSLRLLTRLHPWCLLAFALAFTTLDARAAASVVVTSNAASGVGTLSQAITDVTAGGTITFNLPAGSETITIPSQLSITKALTIDGRNTAGSGTPVTVQVSVPGTSNWRVFNIAPGVGNTVNLSYLTIKGGDLSSGYGGGIDLNSGILNLSYSTVTGSKAMYGGGLVIRGGSTATVSNCTVANNSTTAAGGGHSVGGGLMNWNSTLIAVNSTITGNSCVGPASYSEGGGVFAYGTTLLINCTISGNSVSGGTITNGGGGVYNFNSGSKLYLVNSIVVNNTGANGADLGGDSSTTTYPYYSWYSMTGGASSFSTQATAPNQTSAYVSGNLAALADNGGATKTMAVASGAPARDNGVLVYNSTGNASGYYIRATDGLYHQVIAYGTTTTTEPVGLINSDQRGATRTAPATIGAWQPGGAGPTVTAVSSALADGTYATGKIVPITITFSASVTVTGTPTLALNTTPARTASYVSGSGSATLTFNYTVQSGDSSSLLDYTSNAALVLNGGSITGASGAAVLTLPAPSSATSLGGSKTIAISDIPPLTVPFAWGYGPATGSNTNAMRVYSPVAVLRTGVLAGKEIIDTAASYDCGYAVSKEGLVFGWGSNWGGELGNNTKTSSYIPVAVDTSGALSGKKVTSIAVGYRHCIVLADDGKLYAWGANESGQLGANLAAKESLVPVAVDMSGVLSGKTIKAMSAGRSHTLVLTSDGKLYAAGSNSGKQLGVASPSMSKVFVAVDMSGALSGKTVTDIAAGYIHNLVLCSDGTLYAWGSNTYGELGNASTTASAAPVAVVMTGVLNGKTVKELTAGSNTSYVLTTDGKVFAWGANSRGQLGNNAKVNTPVSSPVAVDMTGALSGKIVKSIVSGNDSCAVLTTDGLVYTWGGNSYGELGTGKNDSGSIVPVAVDVSGVLAGNTVVRLAKGSTSDGVFVLAGEPVSPRVKSVTAPADGSYGVGRQLNFTVTYSSSVTVTGTPQLALTIGATARQATYVSGSGTTALVFRYTVQAGDSDDDGIEAASTIALNGGTLTGSGGDASLALKMPPLSSVRVETVAPSVLSSVRRNPLSESIAASSVIYRVTFSETVSGVDAADFALTTTGTAAGTVSSVSTPFDGAYDVTVGGISGEGTLRLDLKTSGTGIVDMANNAVSGGYTAGEVYTLSAAASAPSINSDTTASGTYGSAFSYTITATNSPSNFTAVGLPSGLSLNAATGVISGTPTQAGSFAVTLGATNAGGSTTGSLSLTIAKATLTVTAANASRAYRAANPLFTLAYNGFVNGDTASSLDSAPTAGTIADDASSVGDYSIVPAGGVSKNYAFTYVSGVLSITKASVTIQLGDLSQTYTGKAISASVKTDPVGVAVDLTYNGSATLPVNVGTYSVAAAVADTNYSGTASGSLTITKANQVITLGALPSTIPLKDFGATPVQLSATSTSGLPVTLSLGAGSAATLNASNQLVSIGSTGTVTIKANQAGTANVNAAPEVSLTLDVVKSNQTLTFAALPDKTFGDASFTLSATASSGLTPAFSVVSGPATISGNTLTLTGAGEVTVRASQEGDASFNAATAVDRTFTVYKGAQTLTFSALPDATFGDGPVTLSATSSASLPVTFAVVSGPGSLSGSTLTLTGAGSVVIRASQSGNENVFAADDAEQTLTVSKKALTATAQNASRAYGAANPVFSISYSGFVGSDTSAALLTLPVASTTAKTDSPAGSYAITLSGGSAANYALTLVNGTLTVGKQDQTITFNAPPDQWLGASPFSLGAVASSGLDISYTVVSGPATVSGKTLTLTGTTGTVTLRAEQAGNASYNAASAVERSFAVGKRTLTVTADNQTRAKGADNPTFTLTYSGFAPGDSAASLATAPTATTTAVKGSPAGKYDIVPSGGVSANYDFVYVKGTLTITGSVFATLPYSWGGSEYGQLGDGTYVSKTYVVPVDMTGALSGKTVKRVATGFRHVLALASDGKLYSWGLNMLGQLGDGTTNFSPVPLAVDMTGALSGKTVVSIATGVYFSLALTEDGKLFSWGQGTQGQLGNNSTANSYVPVAVDMTGVLSGKSIAGIACGAQHAFAWTTDGKVYAWGYNQYGQLGDGSKLNSKVPVAVDMTGVLSGKTITKVAAALNWSLALDSSGKLYAWGYNQLGQLGNNSTVSSSVPVAVDMSGVLAGQTIVAANAGAAHGLALSSTGKMFSWGNNDYGRLGNGSNVQSLVPVAVDQMGVLSGKTVTDVFAGYAHSLALTSEGAVYAWGFNFNGQLGDNTTQDRYVPVAVDMSGALAGKSITALGAGWSHSMVLAGGPSVPTIASVAAPSAGTYGTGRTLDFTVTYSLPVTVTGTPALALTIGSTSRTATYVSGSGSKELLFRYTVQAGDADTGGIRAASTLALNGGTIEGGDGEAGLNFTALDTSGVLVDTAAPTPTSIVRKSPLTSSVTATSVVFRAAFSKVVTGVDASDFALTATGTAAGSVTTVSSAGTGLYDVTVGSLTGEGTLRLDLKASGTGIVDAAQNALTGGYTAGEVYTLVAPVLQPSINSAATASGTYGSAFSYTITATNEPTSFTATGLPDGLSLNATTGVISGTPTQAGQFSVNLAAINTGGTGTGSLALTIAKAPLTVTAQNVSRSYGANNPVFSVTYSGFVNGDTAAALAVGPRVVTTATAQSGVGNYSLTPGEAVSDKYAFTYVNGTLAITAVSTTVTLGSLSQTYTGQGLSPTVTTVPADVSVSLTFNGSTTLPVNPGSYAVVATVSNNNYTGSASGTFTIGKASQTITLSKIPGAIPLKDFGATPVQLTATSTSGLPVTLSLGAGSAATLNASNQLVSIGSTGSVTIKANQPGNVGYNAAPEVTLTLDVVKSNQAITFGALADKNFGDAAFTLSATSDSGLAVTYAIVGGPASVSGNTVTLSGAGEVTVRASQAGNGSFNAAPDVDRTFVVFKGSQTITFPAVAAPTYGDAPIALGATASSGLTVAYTVVSGPATVSGSTLTLTGAGSVTVRASQTGNANVDAAADVEKVIAVSKKTLTATADNQSRAYGADNPPFTITYSGFVGSDTASSLTKAPTANTIATRESASGTYAIELTGGSSPNYAFTLVNGTLTIAKRDQTITFTAPPNQVYGAPAFTLGAAASSGLEVAYTLLGGPATLSGRTVTVTGVGTVEIKASQTGNSSFNPAVEVTRSFTVSKATPTLTWAAPAAISYGTKLSATQLNATASVPGSFVYAPAANAVLGAGKAQTLSVTFTPTDAANYNSATASVSIDVNKAPLTVTADDQTRKYGEANPELTYKVTGYVNGETLATSGVTGAASVSTTATAASAVNTYAIAPAVGTLAASNYSFTFVDGALTVTKAPLTVTADAKSRLYGDDNPTFTATLSGFVNGESLATSGVTGTAAFACAATKASGVGSYAITPSVGTLASGNYFFGTMTDGQLSVTKAPLTVTADAKSRVYGSDNPTFTATLSGFVNGETLATSGVTGLATGTTPAIKTSGVGTYAITPAAGTLASANYAFTTFVDGTLTVTQAALTVTADDKTRKYGEDEPAFTYQITGYLNGDTAAVVTGAPSLTTTATKTSGVGAYAIKPTLGTLVTPNYSFTFVDGALTVTKAPLTVTADAKSRVYGDDNPAFTATLSGFVNGETLATSGVTGAASFTCAATKTSGVGSYAITPSVGTLTSGNYFFGTMTDGQLSVTKAPLTVTADAKSRVYGSDNPAFTATLSGFVNSETLATSGVTGTASGTTPATKTSGVGTYAITPTTGTLDSANYAFTTFVDGALTVTKATLIVTADAKSRVYGSDNPTFTATLSGFANGETLATSGVTGTAAFTCAATKTSGVGSYAITPSVGTLSSGNYLFGTMTDGQLSVTKAPLTVTADAKSRVYGTDNPTFTATLSGFVNGETLATSGVTGLASGTTPATKTSGVGTYAITPAAGTLASANYAFNTFVDGTLTVTQATLTVTADDKVRVYGSENPSFTVTIAGFANGENASTSGLAGEPSFMCVADKTSPVGFYTIQLAKGSLASSNYEFVAFKNGVLKVTPAAAAIDIAGLSQVYDGTPRSVSVVTKPAGIPVALTYSGAPSAPVNAGSYSVVATITDKNYIGEQRATLIVGKASQTLAFPAPSAVSVGVPVALEARASSGLPVSYAVISGDGSLSGASLTLRGRGTVVVRATQSGDDNHLPASVERAIAAIELLPQVIAFGALPNRKANEAPITLTASASSGLPVSFVVLSGPAILSGNTLSLTGATGTVTVRASQPGNATYSPALDVVRSFEVTAAAPQIFFGTVISQNNQQKVGDVAAVLPPESRQGNLLLVARQLGIDLSTPFTIGPDGTFVTQVVVNVSGTAETPSEGRPETRAQMTLTMRGRLTGGVLSGMVEPLNLPFSANVQSPSGPSAAAAGYYQSSSVNSASGGTYSIVGTDRKVLVVAVTPTLSTGGLTTLDDNDRFQLQASATGTTSTVTISGTVDAPTTTVTGAITEPGKPAIDYSGIGGSTLRTDRLVNLSSRGQVVDGQNILIGGFVFGGSEPKSVLLRAVGPGLRGMGVNGALLAPRLQVYDQAGKVILSNTGWGDDAAIAAASARIGAFALPKGSADSAILATLPPGVYTMHVTNAGSGAGVVLAEIYDASVNPQGEYQRLINISTRGQVGAGDGVLIGGFVVTGNAPKKILVRGAGPALQSLFGLSGPLADPSLAVYNAAGAVVARNDDWEKPLPVNSTQATATAAEIRAANSNTNAFQLPQGGKDAALIVTLAPGAYTAVVSGSSGTSGLALVEIYEIPE